MSLDALQWQEISFEHQPRHDLESLFYVILTVCTYVDSPGHLRSSVPVGNEPSLCPNEWWSTRDLNHLVRCKGAQMSLFDRYILRRLPPYWNDFHQVLRDLRNAIWPQKTYAQEQPNVASHDKFLDILTAAQETYRKAEEIPCAYAYISEKQADKSGSHKRKGKNSDVAMGSKRSKTTTQITFEQGPSQSRPGTLDA